ncbi:uncharacterized protein THITE_2106073 [Thermothielavioides terrestris NRRL 8126]|uniref:SET domain-containing protein n=1 Tax=Thermothielavioides terrestris (strain ATCC 38088 / NRRL 8126) TaxID=578455 RepID=G2QW17_THETT|nr:uncharacterized protein THITE_2106073 [Thermothielavioides terrestris NRRL 8126]AEO62188.1 hypothetical protein THITE_2106073 [Thermothielavioides terrestris NRRL 8126]
MDSGFAEGTRRFTSWFQALPGATFHPDIVVEDLRGRGAGRGIIAKADIPADTVLFTIPRSAILCAATSALRDKIPDVFDLEGDHGAGHSDSGDEDGAASSSSQDSWTLLILVLIYEHLQGEASRWRPYLDVLPPTFDTPMFWSPTELSELQASALVAKVGRAEADRMIEAKVLPVIRAHEEVFFPPGRAKLDDAQLFELAHRMGSTIMAYAFDLENDDSDNDEADEDDEWVEDREGRTMLGMVPMADMLNADAEFNAHINHGDDALTATALRPIRAGDEILNYYGPLPNGELLRRYGYVTPKHSRYDVVELPWELVEAELKGRVGTHWTASEWDKVRELVRADDDFEGSFVLERSSADPDSTGQLSGDAVFAGLPDELGEQFKAFLKAAKKVANSEIAARAASDKEMRKELYLQAVLAALQARERQYATSLEDDRQLMDAGNLTGRQEMAVCVRIGEKVLLREAQSWVRRELDELQSQASRTTREDDAPAVKRRRV